MARISSKSAADLLAKLSGRQKEAKKYLPKRTGKRKTKIIRYYATTYPTRKLRNLLKRNGTAAARAWADEHDAMSIYRKLQKAE